jgi:hypothetical protein
VCKCQVCTCTHVQVCRCVGSVRVHLCTCCVYTHSRCLPAARVEYEDRIGFGEFTCASLDTQGRTETFSCVEAINDGYCDCVDGR